MKLTIFALILTYILLLFNFTLKYSNTKFEYQIEYHGFVWVGLDKYSIEKYNSTDKPIPFFYYSKKERVNSEVGKPFDSVEVLGGHCRFDSYHTRNSIMVIEKSADAQGFDSPSLFN